MSIARDLANFLSDQRYEDLPAKATEHAQMLIASTIASASLGSTLESSRIIRTLETDRGGKPQSSAWFADAPRLPAAAAARINALMSDAAACDDSDLRFITHQGTTACATALAVAQHTGASGCDILAAIVLGYEVAGRLGTAMQLGMKTRGFHYGILASFTATITAARLMRLSAEQTTHAIALTATSMGGLTAAANTSVAREYIAGQAAMTGIGAAQAAAGGYTAEETVLEARTGFFHAFGDGADPAAVMREAGQRWSILSDMGIKLMPGAHPFHAIAQAAANAAIEGDVKPQDVEEILVSRPGFQYAFPTHPTDLIGIAHSPTYFAAAAVVDRQFTWAHALEDKIMDPVIRSLLGKVKVMPPPTQGLERFLAGAIVSIRTRSGRTHTSTVYAPRGAAAAGIEWRDVEAKYRALVPYARLSGDNLEASWRVIRAFADATGAEELVSLLK